MWWPIFNTKVGGFIVDDLGRTSSVAAIFEEGRGRFGG
jgi:hypothetical protein